MADPTARKASTRKSARKATPARKDAAQKSSTTEATTKKSARKAAPRKTAAARTESPPQRGPGSRGTAMARAAREAVVELTGKSAESVTGLERTDDGWRVDLEVLELERIPNTTDVLATYQVTLDDDGELQGYRRVHRYVRGSAGEE